MYQSEERRKGCIVDLLLDAIRGPQLLPSLLVRAAVCGDPLPASATTWQLASPWSRGRRPSVTTELRPGCRLPSAAAHGPTQAPPLTKVHGRRISAAAAAAGRRNFSFLGRRRRRPPRRPQVERRPSAPATATAVRFRRIAVGMLASAK